MPRSVCVLLLFVVTVSIAQPPVLTGYDQFINQTSELQVFQGSALNTLYVATYFKVESGFLNVGIVYEPIWGWVGFGISLNGTMYNGGLGDASVFYINPNTGVLSFSDLALYAGIMGDATYCSDVDFNFDAICADVDRGCQNNVQVLNHTIVNGRYGVIEYRRPVNAGDACDRAINVGGFGQFVLLAYGNLTTGTFPYNMGRHSYYSNVKYSITFYNTSVSTTGNPTTGPATTGTTTGQASTTGPAVSTTGSAATTAASISTTGAAVSTTGSTSSTSGGANCNNLTNYCYSTCAPLVPTLCRCYNNQAYVECGQSSVASTLVAYLAIVALLAALLM